MNVLGLEAGATMTSIYDDTDHDLEKLGRAVSARFLTASEIRFWTGEDESLFFHVALSSGRWIEGRLEPEWVHEYRLAPNLFTRGFAELVVHRILLMQRN